MNKSHLALILAVILASCNADTSRVACAGNSITRGVGLDEIDAYPSQLGVMLGDSFVVANFGEPGATMLKNGNKPYWTFAGFRNALELLPDIVIIKLGTNDSKPLNWDTHSSELFGDCCDMIDTFKTLESDPDVWLCYPVPAYSTAYDIQNDNIYYEILPQIKSAAIEKGVPLIDLNTALQDKSDMFYDGIHPTAEGSALIAGKIFQMLTYDVPEIVVQDGNALTAPVSRYYQWYFDGMPIPEAQGGKERVLAAGQSGIYKVAIQPIEGFDDLLLTQEIRVDGTAVRQNSKVKKNIFPGLSLYGPKNVYDVLGREVSLQKESGISEKVSDRTSLPGGVYLLDGNRGAEKLLLK